MPDVTTVIWVGRFQIYIIDDHSLTEGEYELVRQIYLETSGRETFPEYGSCAICTKLGEMGRVN